MKWQEYQEAIALLYENMEGIGKVKRNVYIPDRITGQKRQIDVLIELEERGHELSIVVDAKLRSRPLDVKDIEEVHSLSSSVGANKAVIVASNGWSKPAEIKAKHLSCDLRILTIEQALDQLVPEKWKMCPICMNDCIVLDQDGFFQFENGTIFLWLAGQCRECSAALVFCQDCGEKTCIEKSQKFICGCGHEWYCDKNGIFIEPNKEEPKI